MGFLASVAADFFNSTEEMLRARFLGLLVKAWALGMTLPGMNA